MSRWISLGISLCAFALSSGPAWGTYVFGTVNCAYAMGSGKFIPFVFNSTNSIKVHWKTEGVFFKCETSVITSPVGATLLWGEFKAVGVYGAPGTPPTCGNLSTTAYKGKGQIKWTVRMPNGKWITTTTKVALDPSGAFPSSSISLTPVVGAPVDATWVINGACSTCTSFGNQGFIGMHTLWSSPNGTTLAALCSGTGLDGYLFGPDTSATPNVTSF